MRKPTEKLSIIIDYSIVYRAEARLSMRKLNGYNSEHIKNTTIAIMYSANMEI